MCGAISHACQCLAESTMFVRCLTPVRPPFVHWLLSPSLRTRSASPTLHDAIWTPPSVLLPSPLLLTPVHPRRMKWTLHHPAHGKLTPRVRLVTLTRVRLVTLTHVLVSPPNKNRQVHDKTWARSHLVSKVGVEL